jgi:hypothetical protein
MRTPLVALRDAISVFKLDLEGDLQLFEKNPHKYNFSNMHHNCAENGVDNSSSEAQPHSETGRGSYLDLKRVIFANKV